MQLLQSYTLNSAATLAVLWVGHFIVDAMIGFWSVYKTLAGIDLALAGLIASISPLIGEGLQLLFGSLGDKGYRKPLLLLGIGAGCGDIFLTYTNHPAILFLCYLTTCIGSGAFHPSAMAIASGLTKKRKGLFATIFYSGGALGLAFSHIIFSTWYYQFNGHTLFLLLPSLLLILWALNKQLPDTSFHSSFPKKNHGFSALKELIECKELVTLYWVQVATQSIAWAMIFLLPDILVAKGYAPWICFGMGHFFFVLASALMVIPGGYFSDKYSARIVLLIACGLGCPLFYFFLFGPLLPPIFLLLILSGIGGALGIISPVAVALGHQMMPSRPGLVSAFLMGIAWCLSEAIGPGGGGLLTKGFNENAVANALGIIGVLFIPATLLIARLPEKVEEKLYQNELGLKSQ